ncbi:hypothetical protein SUNI508_02476 [Seiridium unicorne]|uniref:Uncharacterized protein n=1 Tax=Seiridium unicorne TaxID=138068 RepID=A0ABR2UFF9_9PEZI
MSDSKRSIDRQLASWQNEAAGIIHNKAREKLESINQEIDDLLEAVVRDYRGKLGEAEHLLDIIFSQLWSETSNDMRSQIEAISRKISGRGKVEAEKTMNNVVGEDLFRNNSVITSFVAEPMISTQSFLSQASSGPTIPLTPMIPRPVTRHSHDSQTSILNSSQGTRVDESVAAGITDKNKQEKHGKRGQQELPFPLVGSSKRVARSMRDSEQAGYDLAMSLPKHKLSNKSDKPKDKQGTGIRARPTDLNSTPPSAQAACMEGGMAEPRNTIGFGKTGGPGRQVGWIDSVSLIDGTDEDDDPFKDV